MPHQLVTSHPDAQHCAPLIACVCIFHICNKTNAVARMSHRLVAPGQTDRKCLITFAPHAAGEAFAHVMLRIHHRVARIIGSWLYRVLLCPVLSRSEPVSCFLCTASAGCLPKHPDSSAARCVWLPFNWYRMSLPSVSRYAHTPTHSHTLVHTAFPSRYCMAFSIFSCVQLPFCCCSGRNVR